MKICLSRHTAGRGLPLPEFVALASDAGFAGADLDLSYAAQHGAAALADLYGKHNATYGGWGPPFDWRGDEKIYRSGLPELEKFAKLAAQLRIDTCCTYIMPSSERPISENWKFHVQRLRPISQILQDNGLRFGLEFVSPYHMRRHFPHEFLFTPMAMLELAQEISPNTGLLVDTFHLHAAGEPMTVIEKLKKEQIVLAHLNDAPPGPLDQVNDRKRCLPGQGVIDVKGFFAALKSVGYTGPVSLEVFSEELSSLPPRDAARRAGAAVRDLPLP